MKREVFTVEIWPNVCEGATVCVQRPDHNNVLRKTLMKSCAVQMKYTTIPQYCQPESGETAFSQKMNF